MPLVESLVLSEDTPEASRPTKRVVPMSGVDLNSARSGRPRGRRAPDGTMWCLCCDTTIGTAENAAFCDVHRKERNKLKQRRARASMDVTPDARAVPGNAIDMVVEATENLMIEIGRATANFNREGRDTEEDEWINSLMLAAKELTLAVDRGLRPHSGYGSRRRAERGR